MTNQHKKRVFLSFDHEDLAQVNGLRGVMANPNHEFEAYDESLREPIDSDNSEYIKQRIRPKIQRASVTVCLISATTHTSKWVDWELEESERQGNAIIAMALKEVQRAKLPSLILRKRLTFHSWNPSLLNDLIRDSR